MEKRKTVAVAEKKTKGRAFAEQNKRNDSRCLDCIQISH